MLVNCELKRAIIIDLTSKYNPRHFKKGLRYVVALEKVFADPSWEVIYIEDYWLNAHHH